MADHHIQRQILERLTFAPQLSFSELKPDDLANNAFMYHLKQLLSEHLVEKYDDHYRLTDAGRRYADKYSLTLKRPREQPKLLCMIVLRNTAGQYLLAQHKRQPLLGQWGFLTGKQHYGESFMAHAERELTEQLGVAAELTLRGVIDVRISDTALISHIVGPVLAGRYDGPAPADNDKFAYAWCDELAGCSLVPGTSEMAEQLADSDQTFWLSLDLKGN